LWYDEYVSRNQELRRHRMTDLSTRQVPATLPVPAEDVKTIKNRIRMIFPKFTPGTTAEVDPALVELRDYAKQAAAQWELQADLATIAIMQQMGPAERATVNGIVRLRRYILPVKGFWVEPREDDYLKKASK
jgi:hypothetical protein